MFALQSSAPGTPLVAFMVLFMLGGGFAAVMGLANLRTYWVARTRTERRPGEVTSGAVAVSGTARPGGETLTAPLTGEECVAYTVDFAQWMNSKNGSDWTSRMAERDAVPFVIEDETGAVGVEPDPRYLSMGISTREVVEPGDEMPAAVREFVEENETHHEGTRFEVGPIDIDTPDNRFRYSEKRIDVGGEAYVAGTADPDRSVDGVSPTVSNQSGSGFLGGNFGVEYILSDGTATDAAETKLASSLAYVGIGGVLFAVPLFYLFTWFA